MKCSGGGDYSDDDGGDSNVSKDIILSYSRPMVDIIRVLY